MTRIGGARRRSPTPSPSPASSTGASAGASSTRATGSCSPTPTRPLDAAAAAPLSASGTYGPLLLVAATAGLPAALGRATCSTSSPATSAIRCAASTITAGSIGDEQRDLRVECTSRGIDAPARDRAGQRARGLQPPAMSEAEHPDRRTPGHEVTVEDVRQLMGASTPHFALQLRNRIATLIARPAGRPPGAASRASARSRASSARPHRRDPRPTGRGRRARTRCRRVLDERPERMRQDAACRCPGALDACARAAGPRRSRPADPARASAAAATSTCSARRQPASTGAAQRADAHRHRAGDLRALVASRRWDAWPRARSGPRMADEHRIARLLLGLSPGDGVLDVACGPGNFTRDFARVVGPDRAGRRHRRLPDDARPRGRDTPDAYSTTSPTSAATRSSCRSATRLRRGLLLRGAAPVRRPVHGARPHGPRARRPAAASRIFTSCRDAARRRCARSTRCVGAPQRACACSSTTRSPARSPSAAYATSTQRIAGPHAVRGRPEALIHARGGAVQRPHRGRARSEPGERLMS